MTAHNNPPAAAPRLGVLGCGRMAEAMVQRWLTTGALAASDVEAVVRRPAHADALRGRLGIAVHCDATAMVQRADVVLLAIKPQQRTEVLTTLRPLLPPNRLWISVLAGASLTELAALLGPAQRVARVMPNTPSRVGAGVSAVCVDERSDDGDRALLNHLLAALGAVEWLAEADFDVFTAVAGSGPAYVFAFTEALAAAGVAAGLESGVAARIAKATVVGAGLLMRDDVRSPEALRHEVVSPGGTTAAALAVLAQRGQAEAMVAAVAAATARARQLAVAVAAGPSAAATTGATPGTGDAS